MDNGSAENCRQIDRFKKLASDLGLSGDDPESLDQIMGKLDLKKKPEPEKKGKRDE